MSPAPEVAPGVDAAVAGSSAVPRHVAIIMDGNGRWAKKRNLPRVAGHRAGAESLRKVLRASVRKGIEVLTVYAFSSENWRRSDEEIADLTSLMRFYLERELAAFVKEGVRLKIIGDFNAFGPDLTERLERAVERTSANGRITLVVALNYGARAELVEAARKLATDVSDSRLDPADIDEAALNGAMQTSDLPELDLLIRTSGELRLSNFLLWQSAYAELVFTETLWPDFDEEAFDEAIAEYGARQRRFGGR
ncbi:MAG: polyprenyl diphosphate synthase [Sphingomicrobium sp.]